MSNAAKIQDALEKIENLIDCESLNEDPRQFLRDIVVWIGEEIEAGIKLIHTSESALFTVADFRAIVCEIFDEAYNFTASYARQELNLVDHSGDAKGAAERLAAYVEQEALALEIPKKTGLGRQLMAL